jgi:two-component system, chemotaxis family, chemotaxis protein CheY
MNIDKKKIRRILVVDDFSTINTTKCTLEKLNLFDIIEADNGSVALELLRNDNEIGLVLSKCNLPEMNGLDLLKIMRSDSVLRYIPFIMVVERTQKDIAMEAIKAGVSNFVVRPFTAEMLGYKIEQIFQEPQTRGIT